MLIPPRRQESGKSFISVWNAKQTNKNTKHGFPTALRAGAVSPPSQRLPPLQGIMLQSFTFVSTFARLCKSEVNLACVEVGEEHSRWRDTFYSFPVFWCCHWVQGFKLKRLSKMSLTTYGDYMCDSDYFTFLFCTCDWTQAHMHLRQTFHHWSESPGLRTLLVHMPVFCFCFRVPLSFSLALNPSCTPGMPCTSS